MGTLLGTVVMVLVAWTKFWYKTGSPSFGTKSVDTIEAIYRKRGESSVATIVVFLAKVSYLNLGDLYVGDLKLYLYGIV